MARQPDDLAADDLQQTIDRARRGNVAAFNQLVLRFQSAAYSVALNMIGDPDQAADVTQDAFIAAHRAIGRFRDGAFKVWLMRIVTNQCLDYFRARQRRPTVSLDAVNDEDSADYMLESALSDATYDPVLAVERQELRAWIQEGLLLLPEDQRIAVVLSDIEGMSYEEIRVITGAQIGTVKSRIARGRARLRIHLLRRQELLPPMHRLGDEGQTDTTRQTNKGQNL